MKNIYQILISLTICLSACQSDNALLIDGLNEPVEIIRDKWGINHIYAKNQQDLFFAQGYAAAKDRLFQFEIWRRQATGTVAELLGEKELKRDIGTRLFKYRGDMNTEMNYYHEDGVEIITAYADGVNAYINEIMSTPEKLPIEFKLLETVPQKWTPEVVISRHQGLLGNIGNELETGRVVALLGEEKARDLYWFHPKKPILALDKSINKESLQNDILELYNAYRRPVRFEPSDVIPEYRSKSNVAQSSTYSNDLDDHDFSIGSNNWVVNGKIMADGNAYMANDPHRTIAVPSLRYMAHLVAPGWNVIGGGEPEIPGISIGHNEFGTWGLTVFSTDGEDLYVYDLNPENLNQYKYQDEWEAMTTVSENIAVKGQDDVAIDLRYTRHGPVTYVDSVNLKAYAVRCAWMEPGGSPYLASLRMDQAKSWEEFRAACNYSHIPGENMVWADKEGNIGWQSVGIAPIRRNYSGLVPVPGDGRYEWDGYLPIVEKPSTLNPPENYFATANQNVTSEDYDKWDAIGFRWSDPYRGERVDEVLSGDRKLNMDDMKKLQTDYLSIPARTLVPLLTSLSFTDDFVQQALSQLNGWDYILDPKSVAASIYVAFELEIRKQAKEQFVPEKAKNLISSIQLKRVLDWIMSPDGRFGNNPVSGRDNFLQESFEQSVSNLREKLGSDMSKWQYGQKDMKHVHIKHALSSAVNEDLKNRFDAGPLPRGGGGYTPGSTSNNYNQSSGASFRMITNTGNWDDAVGTNPPGQSGNPDSPFYKNLFDTWASDQYFPVFYSRSKVDSVAEEKLLLKPANK